MPPKSAILRLVQQRPGCGDCAIAALATILGIDYETVLVAAARVAKGDISVRGIYGTEIIKIAKKLGVTLKAKKWPKVDQDEDTGIVAVHARMNGPDFGEHVVVFDRGNVIDLRDLTIWEADAFTAHYAADYLVFWGMA